MSLAPMDGTSQNKDAESHLSRAAIVDAQSGVSIQILDVLNYPTVTFQYPKCSAAPMNRSNILDEDRSFTASTNLS
jgi:hypothetical protein